MIGLSVVRRLREGSGESERDAASLGGFDKLVDWSVPSESDAEMIKIAISVEAFEAIARTLPLDNVSYENKLS